MLAACQPQNSRRREPRSDQVHALSLILREEFGVPFRFFEMQNNVIRPVATADDEPAPPADNELAPLVDTLERGGVKVSEVRGQRYQVVLPVFEEDRVRHAAVGYLAAVAAAGGPTASVERSRIEKWASSVQARLRLASGFAPRRRERRTGEQRLGQAWEAFSSLEQALRSMRIDRDPQRELRRLLRVAADVLRVETLIWVPAKPQAAAELEGAPCLSPHDAAQLAGCLYHEKDWETQGFLIRNEPAVEVWGRRFPGVRSVLTLPVVDRSPRGWLLAINRKVDLGDSTRGAEPTGFDRADAVLLSGFAASIGLLVRSSDRFRQMKMLLVGLTRTLTAAIDAKDPYTRGHSERTARIAVEIGRELGLADGELSDVFLAGLLHDVGKLSVSEAILHKREPLTSEEYAKIQQHVRFGHDMLRNLPPIEHLLPAVLHHHEHIDGRGYPDGLSGEAIPLLARIIAVADGCDAMSTPRAYRPAMPFDRVEQTLAQGAGKQWDAASVEALLRVRDRVAAILRRGRAADEPPIPDADEHEAYCLGLSFRPPGDDSTRRP